MYTPTFHIELSIIAIKRTHCKVTFFTETLHSVAQSTEKQKTDNNEEAHRLGSHCNEVHVPATRLK